MGKKNIEIMDLVGFTVNWTGVLDKAQCQGMLNTRLAISICCCQLLCSPGGIPSKVLLHNLRSHSHTQMKACLLTVVPKYIITNNEVFFI